MEAWAPLQTVVLCIWTGWVYIGLPVLETAQMTETVSLRSGRIAFDPGSQPLSRYAFSLRRACAEFRGESKGCSGESSFPLEVLGLQAEQPPEARG